MATSSAFWSFGASRIAGQGVGRVADVDADDRAQRHQRADVVAAVVVVERDRVAAAAELLEHAEEVVLGRVGGDLEHGAVRAHRRRADLDQEVAGDREPGGVAAGELLEADVAERVDQQRRGGLGVHRGVAEVDLAAEAQLVADDVVARVRDRVPDDRDLRRSDGGCATVLTT